MWAHIRIISTRLQPWILSTQQNQGFWIYLYYRIGNSKPVQQYQKEGSCIIKQNGVTFLHQLLQTLHVRTNITNITMIWKTNYATLEIWIRKIFWPTAPWQGCPEKEIINSFGPRLGFVWLVFWVKLVLVFLQSVGFKCHATNIKLHPLEARLTLLSSVQLCSMPFL